MNPNNLVCRTCLGIISEGKVAHNIDEENGLIRNVRNIREMIMFCVPEMDVYISISPVICESCIGILISVYNFKIRCLRVESAIRSYVSTNNLMEGSCVNLNNVVRQQIIEALKQKNWPSDQINEYLDKHLCNSKPPSDRPLSSVFRVLAAQKLNAPQSLNNSNLRAAAINVFEPPPAMDTNLLHAPAGVAGLPPPYPGTNQIAFRPPQHPSAPPGGRFISVSRNLMPPLTERPSLSQALKVVSAPNVPSLNSVDFCPPVPPSVSGALPTVQPQSKGPANMGDFQSTFLSALQLTSTAEGGREEAVLVNKPMRRKRAPRPSKKLVPPQPTNNASYVNSGSVTLCAVTGVLQKRSKKGIRKETGLRTVRKSVISQVGNNKDKEGGGLESDAIIILDDDPVVVTQKVGDELLLMNFDVNDHAPINDDIQSNPRAASKDTVHPTSPTKTIAKQITVRLPMIDPDTLRRKLTTEDVIDEIESKRRKLVVKLDSSLPYLHTKKRLTVKVTRDRFFSCMYCNFTVFSEEALRTHYMSKHKVCSRCTFKTDRHTVLTQHINAMHPLDLKEALKKCEESKEFHCYLCNYTGLSEFDLRDHRLRVHIKCDMLGMYKCPYLTCFTRHAIAYDINKHIEKVHDKLRKVQCPLCNYAAPIVSLLKKHIESHSLMKIKCHLCDCGFKTSFSLKLHMKRKHPNTQDQSTSGMVFGADLNRDDDDTDYRITLDTLQSRSTELRQTTEFGADTTTTRSDQRNLDEYEFALPSLGEMLCAQTFVEEALDQEEDCTIVSEDGPPESHTRKRGGASFTRKTYITKKRKIKKAKESCVDDPDDCMIVAQEIPIVDLSDEDENDNEDCVLVSDDVGIAESFTQKSADNVGDSTASGRPDNSETESCSELSVGAMSTTPVSAVSGSETDTCSEFSASDVLNQKTRSTEDSGKEKTASDNVIGSESAIPESEDESRSVNVRPDVSGEEHHDATKEKSVSLQSDSSPAQSASESELLNKETPLGENMSVANEGVGVSEATQPTTDSLKSAELQSDRPKCTSLILYNKNKGHLMLEADGALIPDTAQPNTSSREIELEETKKLEESSPISESKSPQESHQTPSESFVIDSSDEDSNDCTFVSATEARENVEEESKNHEEQSSKGVEEGTLDKNEVSEVSKGIGAANLKECQERLDKEVDVNEKDGVLVTIEVSDIEAQQNVEEENKDIDKSDDKKDSKTVEKEIQKEISNASKSTERDDIKECQEKLDKDKGDDFVTNDEVSNTEAQENVEEESKNDEEESSKGVEEGTLDKIEVSEVSKGIGAASLKECQEHLDKEVDVNEKDGVLVTNDEVSDIEAQENVEEENKDIDKSDDKKDSEMVEKEILKEISNASKSNERDDIKECQENLDKDIDVKDKGDDFVTNDEVSNTEAQENVEEKNTGTNKRDDEEDSAIIEEEALNKTEPSDVSKDIEGASKGIEGADLKECQGHLDKEVDVKDKDDVLVISSDKGVIPSTDTVSTEPVADDYTLFSDSESDVEVTPVKNHETSSVELTEEKIDELLKTDSEMESESYKEETSQSTNRDGSDILISDSQVESERSESSQNVSSAEKGISDVLEKIHVESSGIDGKSLEFTKIVGIDLDIGKKSVAELENMEKNTNAESMEAQKEDRLSKNEVISERNLANNEPSKKNTQVDLDSTEQIENTQKNVLSISQVTNIVQDSHTAGQHVVDGRDVTDDLLVTASSDPTVSKITDNVNIASVPSDSLQNILSSDKKDDANRVEINKQCSEEALLSDVIQSVQISENVDSQKHLNVEESTD